MLNSHYLEGLGENASLSFHFVLLDENGLSVKKQQFNEDSLLLMASIKKIPIALTLLKKIINEQISLNTVISCNSSYLSPGRPGNPLDYHFFIPTLMPIKKTLYELLRAMLICSDNSSTDILTHYVGGIEVVNQTMSDLGLINHKLTSLCKEMLFEYFTITSPYHLINVFEVMYAFLYGYQLHATEKDILMQEKDVCSAKMMTDLLYLLKKAQKDHSVRWLTDAANIIFEIMEQCETDKVLREGLKEYLTPANAFGSKQGGLGGTRNHMGFINYRDGSSVIFCVQTCGSSEALSKRDTVIIKIMKDVLDNLLVDHPEKLPQDNANLIFQ